MGLLSKLFAKKNKSTKYHDKENKNENLNSIHKGVSDESGAHVPQDNPTYRSRSSSSTALMNSSGGSNTRYQSKKKYDDSNHIEVNNSSALNRRESRTLMQVSSSEHSRYRREGRSVEHRNSNGLSSRNHSVDAGSRQVRRFSTSASKRPSTSMVSTSEKPRRRSSVDESGSGRLQTHPNSSRRTSLDNSSNYPRRTSMDNSNYSRRTSMDNSNYSRRTSMDNSNYSRRTSMDNSNQRRQPKASYEWGQEGEYYDHTPAQQLRRSIPSRPGQNTSVHDLKREMAMKKREEDRWQRRRNSNC